MNLNQYLTKHRPRPVTRDSYGIVPRIICKDEFSLSVQANWGAYCAPRDNFGPWTEVEIGFPSAVPELITGYVDDSEDYTGTIYAYVPIGLVEQLIALHGGIDEQATREALP